MRFFRKNAIELNLFYVYDEIVFECNSTINRSEGAAKQTHLNNQEMLKNELSTILIAQDQFDLRKSLDNIYKYITSTQN